MASDLQARLREATAGNERLCIENDRLRSRLAEAERLLREMKSRNHGACPWCGGYVDHIPGKCDADCALARWLEGGGRT